MVINHITIRNKHTPTHQHTRHNKRMTEPTIYSKNEQTGMNRIAHSITTYSAPGFTRNLNLYDYTKPIPWAQSPNGGIWDADGFVKISSDQTTITFRINNPIITGERTGCDPFELISFTYHYYRHLAKLTPGNEYDAIINKLEEACLQEINRNIKLVFEPPNPNKG
jgi:hypothetical protein